MHWVLVWAAPSWNMNFRTNDFIKLFANCSRVEFPNYKNDESVFAACRRPSLAWDVIPVRSYLNDHTSICEMATGLIVWISNDLPPPTPRSCHLLKTYFFPARDLLRSAEHIVPIAALHVFNSLSRSITTVNEPCKIPFSDTNLRIVLTSYYKCVNYRNNKRYSASSWSP